ncbi:hypothetical protein [Bacillus sp. T3]|uniref:hypothetical protein n=1 Tax=Bacillus sp. T3 TaxID=467262 RepID=UPI002981462F|nr:hypothetical protein [Bacillus sp. T3]
MKFLLDNPFILVILIGILSSFYKQIKGTNSDDNKRKGAIPKQKPATTVGQNNPMRGPVKSHKPVRAQGSQIPNRQQRKDIEPPVKLEDLYSDAKNTNQQNSHFNQEPINRVSASTVNQLNELELNNKKSFTINQERLLDGLIWSEVLGPPRAKRPHRAGRKV